MYKRTQGGAILKTSSRKKKKKKKKGRGKGTRCGKGEYVGTRHPMRRSN